MRCPDCGDPLAQSGVCGSCGYGKVKAKGPPRDPSWWQCSSTDRGQRCAKAGTVAHSTLGGGPWYCLAHAFPNRGGDTRPRAGLRPMRELLRTVDPYEAAERAAIQSDGA